MQEITKGNVSVKISEQGAELKSLVVDGRELMWCADPAYWGKTSPFLFPMVGNTKGDKTSFGGVVYPLGKHGFARDKTWEVIPSEKADTVSFVLRADEQTKQVYPFDFSVEITYRAVALGLRIEYEVQSASSNRSPMPFCIGAHPAFACPFDKNDKFEDYKIVFGQDETVNSPVMDTADGLWDGGNRVPRLFEEREFALDYSLFDNDCVYFDTVKSTSALLTKDGTHGVFVNWENFTSLGVWTPAGKRAPFVCIEPWKGTNDYKDELTAVDAAGHRIAEFEKKRGVKIMPPGGTCRYGMTIEWV